MTKRINFDDYVGQAEINNRVGEVLFADSPTEGTYDPEQYRFEKIIGRRLKTGAFPLKRLGTVHKNVIALHLRSLSNRDIALITGLNESTISRILNDPLAQEVIQLYLSGIDQELQGLAPMAVDALRSGLSSQDTDTQLKAADKFFKATGRYAKAEKGGESAEDVLARALARVASENASSLRELTRQAPTRMLEGKAQDVEYVEGNSNGKEPD